MKLLDIYFIVFGLVVLAYKSEQPTTDWIGIFHTYCCNLKPGDIITNLTIWNLSGYVADVSKYHNAGIWNIY